jgi:cytochrome c oxidase cbb3-type subunit 3
MIRRLLSHFASHKAAVVVILALVATMALLHQLEVRSDRTALLVADPESLLGDPRLSSIAMQRGQVVYQQVCASCHGENGAGNRAKGYPNLSDAEYLYGEGRVSEIERIVLHGIRSGDPRGWNLSRMPAFARRPADVEAGLEPLSPADIQDVAQYVLSLQVYPVGDAPAGAEAPSSSSLSSARRPDVDNEAARRGQLIFTTRGACFDCHGADGKGDTAIGGPNLGDDVWLYGDGSAKSISRSIERGRAGVCPSFGKQLDPADARAVAAFVAAMPMRSRKDGR